MREDDPAAIRRGTGRGARHGPAPARLSAEPEFADLSLLCIRICARPWLKDRYPKIDRMLFKPHERPRGAGAAGAIRTG